MYINLVYVPKRRSIEGKSLQVLYYLQTLQFRVFICVFSVSGDMCRVLINRVHDVLFRQFRVPPRGRQLEPQ